jgi:hypothetical protein
MKLYPNWREILTKAWSIKFGVLATIFALMQVIVPIYVDDLPKHLFAVLTGVSTVGVIVSRLVWQQEV